jgi:hypothetical protein
MLATVIAALPRRTVVVTLFAAAWGVARPVAAAAQPSQTAVATAEVTIKPKQNPAGFPNVDKDAKGSTCVFAAVNGAKAPAGEHRYAGNLLDPKGCDMEIKRSDKDGQPQPAIMIKGGLGMSEKAKFPAVKTAGSKADKEVDADNRASARAGFISAQEEKDGKVTRYAILDARADVKGKNSDAAAVSKDPWFFYSPEPTFIDLFISLDVLQLTTEGDASAGFHFDWAFGRGSVPGSDVLLSGAFEKVIGGNDSFSAGGLTLVDQRLTIDASVDYWLTADVATTATTTPEPGMLVLLGTGIAALALMARSRLRVPSTSCRDA